MESLLQYGTMSAIFAPLWKQLRDNNKIGSIALALLFTYAFFVGPAAWNQNSRLALTRALVERGSTNIDPNHHTTGDKSWRSLRGASVRDPGIDPKVTPGHFYSDKAPGVSLMAAVPYGFFYGFKKLTGGQLPDAEVRPLDPLDIAADRRPEPDAMQAGDVLVYNPSHRVALYLSKLFTSVLLSMLGLGALYLVVLRHLCERLPVDLCRSRALQVSLIYGLATPALAYGTSFYGHQPCADLLLIAFALVLFDPGSNPSREPPTRALLAGFLLGLAVAAEYPAAIPVLCMVVWAWRRRGRQFALWLCLGGLPWVFLLGGYHSIAFGHPLRTGYDFVYLAEFSEGMALHYGFGKPKLEVLIALLFGSYRGLFYVSPVLLLAAWGLGWQTLRAARAPPTIPDNHSSPLRVSDWLLICAIVVYYLVLNAGYYMWDGGAAFGPRHMIPALPFLALGLMAALEYFSHATLALAIISGVHAFLGTTAGPEAPSHGNPVWAYGVPQFLSTTTPSPGASTTLGELLGLPGPFALLPLIALWLWLVPRSSHAAKTATQTREPLKS